MLCTGNHNYAIWTEPVWPHMDTPSQKDLQSSSLSCVWPHLVCLFNVADDPSETENIAKDNPDLVTTMKARLDVVTRSFYEMKSVGTDSCPPDFDLKVNVGTGRAYVISTMSYPLCYISYVILPCPSLICSCYLAIQQLSCFFVICILSRDSMTKQIQSAPRLRYVLLPKL